MDLKQKAGEITQRARVAVNSPAAALVPGSVRALVMEMAALVESMAGKIEDMDRRQQAGFEAGRELLMEVDTRLMPDHVAAAVERARGIMLHE